MISTISPYNTKPKPGAMINPLYPLSRGLVAYYLFNEGAGSRVNDISGYGHHGTLKNMDPNMQNSGWCGSKFGGGLKFDSADLSYVDCGNPAALFIDTPITVACRFKWGGGAVSWNSLFSIGVDTNDRWIIFFQGDAATTIGVYNDINNSGELIDTTTDVTTEWHDIVVTIDGSIGTKIYIDGIEEGSAVTASAKLGFDELPQATSHVGIGANMGWDGSFPSGLWNGWIDSAMIYNRVLSAEEVKQLHTDLFCNLLTPRRWYVPGVGNSYWYYNMLRRRL